jgi:hypothetical protein
MWFRGYGFAVLVVLVLAGFAIGAREIWIEATRYSTGEHSSWWIHFRDFFEVCYYISACLLTIAAILALGQLPLARAIAREATARDKYKIAVEQCQRFDEQTSNELNLSITKLGWASAKPHMQSEEDHAERMSLALEFAAQNVRLINALDSFASAFITNVADENVGYMLKGGAFLSMMRDHGGMHLMAPDWREGPRWKLYELWDKRAQHEKRLDEQRVEAILRALDEANEASL